MRTSVRQWASRARPALLALAVAACGGRTYYTPDIAGVVASIGSAAGGATQYVLANGKQFTIDRQSRDPVIYGPGSPNIGDLLLGGTGPNGPWIARLSPALRSDCPPGSFDLDGGGTDRGQWVETDAGLRLHKMFAGFDPGDRRTPRDGLRYEGSLPMFCVNQEGEVTRFL